MCSFLFHSIPFDSIQLYSILFYSIYSTPHYIVVCTYNRARFCWSIFIFGVVFLFFARLLVCLLRYSPPICLCYSTFKRIIVFFLLLLLETLCAFIYLYLSINAWDRVGVTLKFIIQCDFLFAYSIHYSIPCTSSLTRIFVLLCYASLLLVLLSSSSSSPVANIHAGKHFEHDNKRVRPRSKVSIRNT